MDEFEKACNKVEKERNYDVNNENAISWIRGNKIATVTFSQGRYISKIKKLSEKFPDDVQIVAENKDGSIVAHIPVSYIKINRSARELTDEEKKAIAKRLSGSKTNNNNDETG